MRRIAATLAVVALLFGAGAAWADFAEENIGPSFDCDKASTPTQFAICASNQLSALDRALAAAYKDAQVKLVGAVAERKQLLAEQRLWNKARTTECQDQELPCLVKLYLERIAQLNEPADSVINHSTYTGDEFGGAIEAKGLDVLGGAHPYCIYLLVTELNGDDVFKSVNVSQTFLRGCNDSNSATEFEEYALNFYEEVGYAALKVDVLEEISPNIFLVDVAVGVDGTMGYSLSRIILRLQREPVFEFSEGEWKGKMIIVLSKVGELGYQQTWSSFKEAFKKGKVSFE